MAYPSRRVLDVLPEFRSTGAPKDGDPDRHRLIEFAAAQYTAGRSLREIAELTGRTQTAVRRALDQAGVARRPRGAPRQAVEDTATPRTGR